MGLYGHNRNLREILVFLLNSSRAYTWYVNWDNYQLTRVSVFTVDEAISFSSESWLSPAEICSAAAIDSTRVLLWTEKLPRSLGNSKGGRDLTRRGWEFWFSISRSKREDMHELVFPLWPCHVLPAPSAYVLQLRLQPHCPPVLLYYKVILHW